MTKKVADMTPEQHAGVKVSRARYHLDPEQRAKKQARDREREKTRVLTPEQQERKRTRDAWRPAHRAYLRLLDQRGVS